MPSCVQPFILSNSPISIDTVGDYFYYDFTQVVSAISSVSGDQSNCTPYNSVSYVTR